MSSRQRAAQDLPTMIVQGKIRDACRRSFARLASFLLSVSPLFAAPPSGVFQRDHEITLTDEATKSSQTVTVLDRLKIEAADEKRIRFSLNTTSDDYDSCRMTGRANPVSPNVYEFTQRLQSYEDALCRLRIRIGKDRIVLEDVGGHCREMYCGKNAALDKLAFPTGGQLGGAPPRRAKKARPASKKAPRGK